MENEQTKENSRLTLAVVLIILGVLWLLHKLGSVFEVMGLHLRNLILPFKSLFVNWGSFIFSWQMILILVGLVLLAGKRSSGLVLIVLGGLFLAPKILAFPHISLTFILPVILIGAGVALIAKLI
ncbi:hypothetical protein SAMN05444274_103299 [Mariniphaga anaerophila]|uniref:LiaF transmembrane domain-containing protein n=1 Tax=Mariniphaga anaerophila TaxID=1484053 RepID=A0A1M4YBX0_9BACT|nr:hypothetical protein [Mariniphaga anaerophila]SHF03076.1 hypothetical protein SAMN05444274_103299 [Mariniphaga anaerophila]